MTSKDAFLGTFMLAWLAFALGFLLLALHPVVGILVIGFSAVVLILARLGTILFDIGIDLGLLAERRRKRRDAQEEARLELEHQSRRDYWVARGQVDEQRRRRRWREVMAIPGQVNDALRRFAGRDNAILYQFVRAVWFAILLAGLAAGGYLIIR